MIEAKKIIVSVDYKIETNEGTTKETSYLEVGDNMTIDSLLLYVNKYLGRKLRAGECIKINPCY